MDWTRNALTPKILDFTDGVAYAEWLLSHSVIPEVGEVYVIRLRAEDFLWMKAGDGKTALIDLPHMIIK